ncbi:response regulator receiver modulated translation initiation factor IF-2 (plasmid) [Nostoc carneum NIES-2107]|nr:response regulator receiver modulated translation initiation factor IF-2 [Nostoc carneum NIES-2107]
MANAKRIKQERATEVSSKRIEGFANKFGKENLHLLCHAAFPIVLTPDLLYHIWAIFVPEAPWIGVAHVLLSRLCHQVGYEIYEMDITDRNLLLHQLKQEFGQKRFDELSEFLLDYVAQKLTSDDEDTCDLRQAQEWTALVYTNPDEVAYELVQVLSQHVYQDDIGEVLRLSSLVEVFAEPLKEAGFNNLLIYSQGMESFARGDIKTAKEKLTTILLEENQLQIAGLQLSIPEQLALDNHLYHYIENSQSNTQPISTQTLASPSILVVDDSPDVIYLIKAILEEEGYQVSTAENGIYALSQIETNPPDLILLDLMMPGIDGYEVTRRVREEMKIQSYIPILLITSHDAPNIAHGLNLGADDFIRKPVTIDELLARIKTLLRLSNLMKIKTTEKTLINQQGKLQESFEEKLQISLRENKKRFQDIIKERKVNLPQSGTWEIALKLIGDVPLHSANQNFLNLLSSSNPKYTGWPIWLDSRGFPQEQEPFVFHETWEALIINFDLNKSIDFMRLNPKGKFSLIRALEDDLANKDSIPPMKFLDACLHTVRIAEAMAVSIEFAKAMGCSPTQTQLAFAFKWSSLRGRRLYSWAKPQFYSVSSDLAYQDEVISFINVPLETSNLELAQYVRQAINTLLRVFGGFELSIDIVKELTKKLIERKL